MRKLSVLYDAGCGFCSACRQWLERQRQIVRLEFLPATSLVARRRFPTLAATAEPEELIVVSDDGGVYRGSRARVMCLWALRDYRAWAHRLARPSLLPLARTAFEWLSTNRRDLSRLLRLPPGEAASAPGGASASCRDGRCDPSPARMVR